MSHSLSHDEELVRRLPLPLAQLYRRAQNAKTALERHLTSYYLWEAGLKLLGAVTLVEYGNRGLGHGAAGQRTVDFYEKMSRALLGAATGCFGKLDVIAGGNLLFVGEVRRQSSGSWLMERFDLGGENARRLESLELP